MPGAFKDKELASRAGKSSTGPTKKTTQWEQLGDFITKAGAIRAMKILGEMSDEDYLDQYGKLLAYFKPRLASTQIQAKVDTSINIIHPDEDIMDKI